jgi:invasion protein IalB
MIFSIAAAAAVAPQPANLHTYKDWIVGCDNIRVCQANALEPDGGDDDYLATTISRSPMSGDRAALFVPLPEQTEIGDSFSLKVDGTTVVKFTASAKESMSFPLTGKLLVTLRKGERLMLLDAGGKSVGVVSLAGLAAALRYIDDQQGRVGTVGALEAIGTKADAVVPTPPAAPVIFTPAPSSRPPRTISVAAATQLIDPDNATCDYAHGKVEPRSYRLDAKQSLVLIDIPCGNGAYNFYTGVYVLGETGAARAARFDLAPGMGELSTDGTGELTNGDWDPKTRKLSSYEKGRGLGDCGTTEGFVWDGARFRLVEQNAMGECRGSVDFIRTWIARSEPLDPAR